MVVMLLLGGSGVALADSYYWHIPRNDGTDTPTVTDIFPSNTDYQMVVNNPATRQPEFWTTDTSMVWNDAQKRIEIGNISQDNIDLLVPTLAGKASTSSVNALSTAIGEVSAALSSYSDFSAPYIEYAARVEANVNGTGTGLLAGTSTNAAGLMTRAQNDKLNALPAAQAWSMSAATHSLVTGTGATGFQISSTRNSTVRYDVTVTTTASIAGNAGGYIALEVAPTNSATAGDWVEVGRCGNSQALSLAITLQSVQGTSCQLSADVPSGYYAKLRSVTTTGTLGFAYNAGHETLK